MVKAVGQQSFSFQRAEVSQVGPSHLAVLSAARKATKMFSGANSDPNAPLPLSHFQVWTAAVLGLAAAVDRHNLQQVQASLISLDSF